MNSGKDPLQILKDNNVPVSHIQKIRGYLNTPLFGNILYGVAAKQGYSKEQVNSVFDMLEGKVPTQTVSTQPSNIPTSSTAPSSSDISKYKNYTKFF